MKKFRTVFFKGYQKDEVDEYIETLISELESLKEKADKDAEEGRKAQEELKNRAEQAIKEREELEQRLEAEISEKEKLCQEYNRNLEELKQQIEEEKKKRKIDYNAAVRVISIAEQEAKRVSLDARANAEKVLCDAKSEADALLAQADREVKEKRSENEKLYMAAKYKLAEYLNSINRTQSKLIESYNELGLLVKKMPLRIGDIFSDDPLELLPDDENEE